MKYIGATNRFIKGPFIFEGMIIGFFGAVLAFIAVFLGYLALLRYAKSLSIGIFKLVGLADITPMLAVLFVIFGSLIGIVGSSISMKKHLRV